MPLSRHFYSQDDVQAALFHTGSRGIPEETVFWCRELVESGWVAEAIATLFESWLWNRAPFGMDWFMDAHQRLGGSEVAEEDVLLMAERLSCLPKKDHSLWWLFVREGESVDRVSPRTPSGMVVEENREAFFYRALYQGKARSAWWAGGGFSPAEWWERIENYRERVKPEKGRDVLEALRAYEGLLGYSSEAYDRAIRGCVVLWLCACEEKESVGRKGGTARVIPTGRSLSLPHLGLYGMSRRGRMSSKETTMKELWNVWEGMKGCPYWEEVGDRDADEHFPQDVPDEWTREEKEKSHGVGLVPVREVPNLWGYTKRYMMGTCRGVWMAGPMAPLQERLERVVLSEEVSPFQAILSLLFVEQGPLALAPVHKKKQIRV